ncbi:MAG: response regulator [Geovibrio sp.]|nr:response regulator [Geovibrio sp.]
MGKMILSVDDSASIRQMVKFTLTKEGYEVIEAGDGADALSKVAGKKIDRFVTDL